METAERFWKKVTVVGPDECWPWTAATASGYGTLMVRDAAGQPHMMGAHRYSWELHHGPIPPGYWVDHKCFNKLCVNPNPGHLRLATRKQNQENREGAARNSKTGIRGVSPHKGGYQATLTHNGKQHYLGWFKDKEKAAAAVAEERQRIFTHTQENRPENIPGNIPAPLPPTPNLG